MSPEIGSSLTVGLVIASATVLLEAQGAAATVRDRHTVVAAHRVHRANAAHRRHHFARRPLAYGYNNTAPEAFVGPDYVFVPGRGILDEDCDMPTSTCPNDVRDIQ